MNNKLILWIAAVIVTLLVLFLHRRMGPYYPVSGTLQLGDEKVIFVLPKIHYGYDSLKLFIRNDITDISGQVFWKDDHENLWHKENIINEGKYLTAFIPPHKAGEYVIYKGEFYYNDSTYHFPRSGQTEILFKGKRPSSVLYVLYFFLYMGLLLSVRSALDYFNPDDKKRLFAFMTTVCFFIASIVFFPLIKSYELDVINKSIPPVTSLFEPVLLTIFILWSICSILVFWHKNKLVMLISGILTLIIYQFSSFY